MSLSYNLADKPASAMHLLSSDPSVRYAPQKTGGLLISPESAAAQVADRSARITLFWLGMGLILSAFALVISLVSLALS
jgi:hypothetical protein